MSGETNLEKLLSSMSPQLLADEYVFVTLPQATYGDYAELSPIASYMETEGLTLVLTKENADSARIAYGAIFKCITLLVHSSLEAVGLTAVVATQLAKYEISANVIAGYYHDHIFVQARKAKRALTVLNEIGNKY